MYVSNSKKGGRSIAGATVAFGGFCCLNGYLVAVFAAIASACGISSGRAQQTVSVLPGVSLTLSVSAEGTAPFVYVWRKDGAILTGVSGDRYLIGSFDQADVGAYTVTVSNAAGSTTSAATMLAAEVVAAPAIVEQPGPVTAVDGGGAAFRVVATGSPSPSFRWRRDGVMLVDGPNIFGAQTDTLILGQVGKGDEGAYSVVLANPGGSVVSADAGLTVVPPPSAPVFTSHPVSVSVKEGANVVFDATATGNPAPSYRWYKDGQALSDGGKISGAATVSLALTGVRSVDAGVYTLVASNFVGVTSSSGAAMTVSVTTTQKSPGKPGGKSTTESPAGSLDGLNLYNDTVPVAFDVPGYLARYPKYKQKFGSDGLKAWLYYRDTGVKAGEVYDKLFRAEEYLALNPDVLAAYGADLRAAVLHWVNFGFIEGRQARY